MANPLFESMMKNQRGQANNPMSSFMQRYQQFAQNLQGDPRQQVQNLLNSGRVSQEQYNRAVQMANQMMQFMGKK